MREIVLDTETTGLDPALGHRIVEIGAIELYNHVPTGQTYHVYLNPERDMPAEAEAIHGLGAAFLRDKPTFSRIVQEFIAFLGEAVLVIHNAGFDMAFINAELSYVGRDGISPGRIIDTLHLARQKHPSGPNSLDALCRRYGVDLSRRTKHGALLDSELLAEVYLELIGGRQTVLSLATTKPTVAQNPTYHATVSSPRLEMLPTRLSTEEMAAHRKLVDQLGDNCLWKRLRP